MLPEPRYVCPISEPCRDVVFVFGAGTSYSEGVPLQSRLLPKVLDNKSIVESKLGAEVVAFLRDHFSISRGRVPDLETVFGYLDYFILQNESLPEYPISKIVNIKQSLIEFIHFIIDESTPNRSNNYRRFWDLLSNRTLNVGVVTTNYDNLLEEAFDFLYSDRALIDYCIPLMNYELHHGYARTLDQFNWWENPRGLVPVWNDGTPHAIKIVKLHGSLNWKYCPCCGQVLLTPWDSRIDLDRGGFTLYRPPEGKIPGSSHEYLCPLDSSRFETLIVPPSHVKELQHPIISRLRGEAAQELRSAHMVVFVGYSFPEADVHLKALFRKNIPDSSRIVVVNRTIDTRIQDSFSSLGKPVEFSEETFESMLADGGLLDTILEIED